jgi:hypothetical protein
MRILLFFLLSMSAIPALAESLTLRCGNQLLAMNSSGGIAIDGAGIAYDEYSWTDSLIRFRTTGRNGKYPTWETFSIDRVAGILKRTQLVQINGMTYDYTFKCVKSEVTQRKF